MEPRGVLIGYGSIGSYHAAHLAQRCAHLAIVELSVQARERAQQAHGEATVVTSLEAVDGHWLWEDSIAVIATWGPTHYTLFNQLADRGVRRILCEKPLAHSVFLADQMAGRARKDHIALASHQHYQYSGFGTGLAELAATYGIGAPVSVVVHGGAAGLETNGIYFVPMADELFGCHAERVLSTARGAPINPRSETLQFFGGTAVWSYGEGRELVVSFTNQSSVAPIASICYRNALVQVFPDLTVELRHRDPELVRRNPVITRTGPATKVLHRGPIPGVRAFEQSTAAVYDELASGNVSCFPPEAAAHLVGDMIGALESGRIGRVVSLPIDPDSQVGRNEWPIS